jgi:hypothetical protein
MSSLNQALRLNNDGVMLLLENRDQEAVTCLTQSLNMIKHNLLANPPSDDSSTSRSSSNPFNSKALNIHHTAHSLPNLHDSNFFIYSSLLAFSIETDFPSENSTIIHVYSAVIILNIALAYHRKGVLGGNKSCLAKAEKMYDMVAKLLSGCEDNQGIALVAKLASINNLFQLRYKNQGDYDRATSPSKRVINPSDP